MSGHFAQTGPVLGGRLRAGPVPRGHPRAACPRDPAPPGPLLDDFAGDGSLRVHFARTGPAGAFSRAGPALGPLAPPVQGQLAAGSTRARVSSSAAHAWNCLNKSSVSWLTGLGLALSDFGLPLTGLGLDSDRQVQQPQQFRRAAARPLSSSANPACRRLFELLTSTDRLQAEAPVCRPTNPSRSQRAQPDFRSIESRCRSPSPLQPKYSS